MYKDPREKEKDRRADAVKATALGLLGVGAAGTYYGTRNLGKDADDMLSVGRFAADNANDIVNSPEVGAELIDRYADAAHRLQKTKILGGVVDAGKLTELVPPSPLIGNEVRTLPDGTTQPLNFFERLAATLGVLPNMDAKLKREMDLSKNHYHEFNQGRGVSALIREGMGGRDAKATAENISPDLVNKYGWDTLLKHLHVQPGVSAKEALKGIPNELYRETVGQRLGTIFVGGGETAAGKHWGKEGYGNLNLTKDLKDAIASSSGPAQYGGAAKFISEYGRPVMLGLGATAGAGALYYLKKRLADSKKKKRQEEQET